MAYEVRLKRTASKAIKKLDSQAQQRVLVALDMLASDPHDAPGVKSLQGRDGFRIRVGNYRIIYEIDGEALVVLVLRVGHRREVYR